MPDGTVISSDLCDLQAVELLYLMEAGSVSAVEVLGAHLDRIDRVNPALNAIVTLATDDALIAARAADDARRQGTPVGPLHGLPVGVKDLVETAGIRTTYGSPIFSEHVPVTDATIVTRLKSAGAIVLGKTNTPEFGA